MEQIANLLGSFGFPIVACVFLWKFISTTLQEFTKAMTNNTKMLEKVSDSIDKIARERGEEKNE